MADQTAVRPVNALGGIAGNLVLSPTLAPIGPGIAAAVVLWSGEMVGLDASGNMVSASSAAAVTCVGIARATFDNRGATAVPPTSGLAGAISGTFLVGPYSCLGDGTVTASTPFGTDLFVVDNQTVSTSDVSATGVLRLRAGYFVTLDTNGNPVVQFGVASPTARAFSSSGGLATPALKARVVMTSLGANTGTGTGQLTVTATGALAAQDGVTLAAGDVVFIQEGTTNLAAAKDAGPWVVTVLGATGVSPVLSRPDWWVHGAPLPQSAIIDVGGEGTAFPGTQWKSFVAKAKVIDTDAPVFWPRDITQTVTLVAGTAAAITSIPIRQISGNGASTVTFLRTTINTATATIQYGVVPVATAGVTGSSSIVPMAQVGAGTINNADISTLLMNVSNW